MDNRNTVPKQLTPFVKGDPRINRKGRPKSFDALRTLAQAVAHEVAMSGAKELVINGHKVTVAEAIIRQWAQSKNPQLQRAFIEIAFGKVPDQIDVSWKIEVVRLLKTGRITPAAVIEELGLDLAGELFTSAGVELQENEL